MTNQILTIVGGGLVGLELEGQMSRCLRPKTILGQSTYDKGVALAFSKIVSKVGEQRCIGLPAKI